MKLTQIIVGKGRGKLGAAIGYVVAGQQLAREYVPHVKDRMSETQQDTRYAKFKPAIEFAKLLKYWKTVFFPTAPSGKTRYSAMLKQIFPAFGGTMAAPTADLSLITLGNGTIPMKEWATAAKDTFDSINLTWSTAINSPAELDTDEVWAVLTSADKKTVVVQDTGATRIEGLASLGVPEIMSGTVVTLSSMLFIAAAGGNELASKVKVKGAIGTVNLA
jgi:hypothetical protein